MINRKIKRVISSVFAVTLSLSTVCIAYAGEEDSTKLTHELITEYADGMSMSSDNVQEDGFIAAADEAYTVVKVLEAAYTDEGSFAIAKKSSYSGGGSSNSGGGGGGVRSLMITV